MQKIDALVHDVQKILDSYNRDKKINNLLGLKKALYPIDNLITFELSCSFVKWLKNSDLISGNQADEMLQYLNNTNTNANGFDIVCNSDNGMPIIAEVKGTIPYLSDKYGSAQTESIKKDLGYLTGKIIKRKNQSIDINKYYKFMVMLKSQDGENDEVAMKNLLKGFSDKNKIIILNDSRQELSYETVYVVFIELEN